MNDEMSKYNDSELAKFIENGETMIDELKDEIRDIQNDVDAFKAEQEARTLAAYWKANPQLTPLTVGDKLLVTDALFDLRERDGGWPKRGSHIKIGSICEIYQYDSVVKDCWFVKCGGSIAGLIPTDIIQDMRRAYLATVNESNP